MKLKFEVNVPRPTGTWTIKKWNILKGETEADGVEVTQNNLITDEAIKLGYFKSASDFQTINFNPLGVNLAALVLSRDATAPVASSLQSVAQADSIETLANYSDFNASGGVVTTTKYFWPSGAPSIANGEVINSLKYFNNNGTIRAWLKLSSPITVSDGDVIKVTYTFSGAFPQVTSTGKLTPKLYAYGENPDNPAHGTAGTEVDYTLTTDPVNFGALPGGLNLASRSSRADEVTVNPDGSLQWTLVGGFKSSISNVTSSATNITTIQVREADTSTNTSTLTFSGTLPQQTPGSYYELEIEVTYKVAAP